LLEPQEAYNTLEGSQLKQTRLDRLFKTVIGEITKDASGSSDDIAAAHMQVFLFPIEKYKNTYTQELGEKQKLYVKNVQLYMQSVIAENYKKLISQDNGITQFEQLLTVIPFPIKALIVSNYFLVKCRFQKICNNNSRSLWKKTFTSWVENIKHIEDAKLQPSQHQHTDTKTPSHDRQQRHYKFMH